MNRKNELRNELLKEIRKDEYEYCFDPSYCPDEQWKQENDGKDRKTVFQETMKYFNALSIEEIMNIFGDKYNFVIEQYE